MQKAEEEALQSNLLFLCKNLEVIVVLTHLEQSDIIQNFDRKNVMAKQTFHERNQKFIDILKTKGKKAYSAFIAALKDTGQKHIAEQVEQSFNTIVMGAIKPNSANTLSASESQQQKEQNSSSCSFNETCSALRNLYKKKFKNTNPLSDMISFDFDIEQLWVPLQFQTQDVSGKETNCDDYVALIDNSLREKNILIIEGRPACGKSALMKRIAYAWANQDSRLSHYKLMLIVEFRHVHNKQFPSILKMVVEGMRTVIEDEEVMRNLEKLLEKYDIMDSEAEKTDILVLLDGYDEAHPVRQCQQLENMFDRQELIKELPFKVIMTTRPGTKAFSLFKKTQFLFCEICGFTSNELKKKYIEAHFRKENNFETKLSTIQKKLDSNKNLDKLAETPFFLTCICLVYKRLEKGTLFELYDSICWYLLNRYQVSFPEQNVPRMFRYEKSSEDKLENQDLKEKINIIRYDWHDFSLFRRVGKLALSTLTDQRERLLVLRKEDLVTKYGFSESEITIVAAVGLLRKELRKEDEVLYAFFHQTMQEFLAAMYFCYWATVEERISENIRSQAFLAKELKNHNVSLMPVGHCEQSDTQFSVSLWYEKEILYHVAKAQGSSEIEAFVWRIAIQSNEAVKNITKLLEHYKCLKLNLSHIDYNKNCSLFECLEKCNNLSFLEIDGMFCDHYNIDLRNMKSLTLIRLSNFHFGEGSICLEINQQQTDLSVEFFACEYSSMETFIEHLKFIERIMMKVSYENFTGVARPQVYFYDAKINFSNYYSNCFIIFSGKKDQFISNISFETENSHFSKEILSKLWKAVSAAQVTIDKILFHGNFRSENFSIKYEQQNITSILTQYSIREANPLIFQETNFSNISFPKPSSEMIGLNIKTLEFNKCTFDISSWSSMILFLNSGSSKVNELKLRNLSFSDKKKKVGMKTYVSHLAHFYRTETLLIETSKLSSIHVSQWIEQLPFLASQMECLRNLKFIMSNNISLPNSPLLYYNVGEVGKRRWGNFKYNISHFDELSGSIVSSFESS